MEKRVKGLEPSTFSLGSCNAADENPENSGILKDGADEKGQTVSHPPPDPDLARLNAVWPSLSPRTRAEIVDLIGGNE